MNRDILQLCVYLQQCTEEQLQYLNVSFILHWIKFFPTIFKFENFYDIK